MNMMDIMKKSLAFGLGAAAFSAEKMKQFADDMVARGEMTSDEAKHFVDDVNKRADEEKVKMQDWMREQMSKMLQQAGAVEVERVERLEARVAQLEKRIALLTADVAATEEALSSTEVTQVEETTETGEMGGTVDFGRTED